MGWTSIKGEKRDGLRMVKADVERSGARVLSESILGREVWLLIQKQDQPPFILLALIEQDGGEVAWKLIDEECHPYYYGCPISFLDAAPVTCQGWRDQVVARHQKVKAKRAERKSLRPGLRVRSAGRVYTLVEKMGRRGWKVTDEAGVMWRMPANRGIEVLG